ncbi:WD40/YVTN/BNR-like repeat-containing protein [Lentzea sp. NPDC051213]|uniref:WD40/YVTN/BNR-like repeat-containing protein n=1 Tax=Lentzea sp. NPDC051213 TaxID=3364126 RepID=UPI003790345E
MISLLAALLVVVTPPVAQAGPSTGWANIGPNGAGGYLAFAQNLVYVLPGAGQQVFRSDDRGRSWRQGKLLPEMRGNGLAADPARPDTVLVAGYEPGGDAGTVLRSADGGNSFSVALRTPSGVEDVAFGAAGVSYAATAEGVYRGVGGLGWSLLPGSPASAEDVHVVGSDVVVAAGGKAHVLRAGKWSAYDVPADKITSRGDVVVARKFSGGVHLSSDRGASWRAVTGPWTSSWILYGGITANGWVQVQTLDGHFISQDLGASWTRTDAVKKVDVYTEIGSFADLPDWQWVYASGGVYATADHEHYKRVGVPGAHVLSLAVSGRSIIAGTMQGSFRTDLPVASQEWDFDGTAPPAIGNRVGALAARDGVVLRGRNAYRGSQDMIYVERSLDGGRTWVTTDVVPGNTRSLVFDPALPSRVYLGAYLINAFYVSLDGGLTFTARVHAGLRGIKTIAADPTGIWLADAGGLYRSTDAGVTIKQVVAGRMNSVLVDPRDPKHVVAVGQNSVFVSFDGASFTEVPNVSAEQLSTLTSGPDGVLYLGSISFQGQSKGVLRSVNGGRSWSVLGGPEVERGVEALLVSSDGRTLYAGTVSGSVHRRSLG